MSTRDVEDAIYCTIAELRDMQKEIAKTVSVKEGVYSYYYRPNRKCFKAGFLYTLGGITAIALTVLIGEVWQWIAR